MEDCHVKVGFIVEGYSERILIESHSFKQWCIENGITVVEPVINARGGGNLLPEFFVYYEKTLSASGRPDKIVVLTDREKVPTSEMVEKRILQVNTKKQKRIDYVFVSVKAIEAWFLADDQAMSSWLKERFHEEKPERTSGTPWERIKEIASSKGRGPGSNHLAFAQTIIKSHGFSIERAATHPNCSSVKEFHKTLKSWGEGNP
jgi:hypothetical protein